MLINFDSYEKTPDNPEILLSLAWQCFDNRHYDSAILLAEFVYLNFKDRDFQIRALDLFNIVGFYSKLPERTVNGAAAANKLYLTNSVGQQMRQNAGINCTWYAKSASEIMPSTTVTDFTFKPPIEYTPINPSVCVWNDQIWVIVRSVNYITDHKNPPYYSNLRGENCINTRNWLLRLNHNLDIVSVGEVLRPYDMPLPQHGWALGFEECRLFVCNQRLWCTASVRQLNQQGRSEQVLTRIDALPTGYYEMTNWKKITPIGLDIADEKNWMPVIDNDQMRFLRWDKTVRILDADGNTITQHEPQLGSEYFRGGSQGIPFDNGWLFLIHEKHVLHRTQRIRYMHRFVWLDSNFEFKKLSNLFYIKEPALEYIAGAAIHPNNDELIAVVTVDEIENHFVKFKLSEIRQILKNCQEVEDII